MNRFLVFAVVSVAVALKAIGAAEMPIADPALHPANDIQRSPAIAGSGNGFFTAWADARARIYDDVQPSPRQEWDTYGARIGTDGSYESWGGVAVSATPDTEDSPAVVWNGSEYVVISASWPWFGPGQVIFTPVGVDGPPHKGVAVRPAENPGLGYGSRLAAAWNGSEYLVILGYSWPTSVSDPTWRPGIVRGFLVDSGFGVVKPLFEISDPAADSILPAVASNGTDYLVTWIDVSSAGDRAVRTATVSAAGAVQRQPQPLAPLPRNPEVFDNWPAPAAWDGQHYLVTWSDGWSVGGRLVDGAALPVSGAFDIARTLGVAVFAPSVAWNGSMFLVGFSYRNEWFDPKQWPVTNLYAARVRPDGTLIDQPYPLTITAARGAQTVSAVAASGGRFAIAWESEGDVRFASVDPLSGAVSGDTLLTRSARVQSDASAVFDGRDFGVLWNEGPDVLFGRLSIDGRHLDGAGRVIGSGRAQALLWNGNVFLAAWVTPGGSLQAMRFSSAGENIDPEPLILPGGSAFSTDGSDFLVLTGRETSVSSTGALRYHLAAYRITASGSITAPQILPATSEFTQAPAGVAWNGSHYAVVYVQYLGETGCYKCFPPYEGRLQWLDREGKAVGDASSIPMLGPVAAGAGRVIVAGTEWVEAGQWNVRVMMVDESGVVVAPETVGKASAPYLQPAVAWDGEAFAVMAGSDIVRVAPDGGVVSREGGAVPAGALEARLVPARGATPLLLRRIDVLPPWHHPGGLERYFIRWPDLPRVRGVAHR